MLMNLWVRCLINGKIHQIGTQEYDSLEFMDGRVEYINLRTNGGTHDGDYIFVDPPSHYLDLYIASRDMLSMSTPIHLVINKKLKPSEENDREKGNN